jgi:hypothetical protein
MAVAAAAATKMLASCLILAAQSYNVPPAAMIGIMHVEGGHIGQQVMNTNGSYDLGPMQVNTLWLPQLARLWHVDARTAHMWVRDNGCVNVYVAAWILRQKMNDGAGLYNGIARYHSGTGWRGARYANQVVAVMQRKGLVLRELQQPSAPPIRTAEVGDDQKSPLKIAKNE